jgi:hypothetical protein
LGLDVTGTRTFNVGGLNINFTSIGGPCDILTSSRDGGLVYRSIGRDPNVQ